LLERDETRRVGSSDTGTTVLDRLVGDGELSEVVSDHLRLDLSLVEDLSVVDSDDGSDHLGEDDHVTEVGLDGGRLLEYSSGLLGLLEASKKSEVLALESAGQTSAGARLEELGELLSEQVEELVEINSAVRELAESSLLLKLSKMRLVLAHV
ncbi:hypothetical protein PFISCL1PPCAC_20623, partial [Pristionchus fissidentatus]